MLLVDNRSGTDPPCSLVKEKPVVVRRAYCDILSFDLSLKDAPQAFYLGSVFESLLTLNVMAVDNMCHM